MKQIDSEVLPQINRRIFQEVVEPNASCSRNPDHTFKVDATRLQPYQLRRLTPVR